MTRVTGVGCALGALDRRGLRRHRRPRAGGRRRDGRPVRRRRARGGDLARGPGSFAAHLLDELSLLDGDALAGPVRLS